MLFIEFPSPLTVFKLNIHSFKAWEQLLYYNHQFFAICLRKFFKYSKQNIYIKFYTLPPQSFLKLFNFWKGNLWNKKKLNMCSQTQILSTWLFCCVVYPHKQAMQEQVDSYLLVLDQRFEAPLSACSTSVNWRVTTKRDIDE